MKKIILLIGMPGSGKGTIGKICEEHGCVHISSSKLLKQSGYDLKQTRDIADKIVTELIKAVVNSVNDTSTIILEGFPRRISQLELLEKEFDITKAIYLKIPKSIAKKRVIERIVCNNCGEIYSSSLYKRPKINGVCDKCGSLLEKREEDTQKIFEKRAGHFAKNSYPIIRYYSTGKKLVTVDATKTVEEIATLIKSL